MSNVLNFNEKREHVQRLVLQDLEDASIALRETREKLRKIEKHALDNLLEAFEENKLTPYKGAVAFHKMVEGVTKVENLRIQLYDRIQGMTWVDQPENVPETVEDLQNHAARQLQRKTAEQLTLEIVRLKMETDKLQVNVG